VRRKRESLKRVVARQPAAAESAHFRDQIRHVCRRDGASEGPWAYTDDVARYEHHYQTATSSTRGRDAGTEPCCPTGLRYASGRNDYGSRAKKVWALCTSPAMTDLLGPCGSGPTSALGRPLPQTEEKPLGAYPGLGGPWIVERGNYTSVSPREVAGRPNL
jgi:hypothetical protein